MLRKLILPLLLLSYCTSIGQFALERNAIYGGNAADEAKDIALNPAKTLMFLGGRSFSTDGNLPGNAGASDFWIMKRNIDGTPVWSYNYGGLSNDDLAVVLPHTDGGVIAFGTTHTDQGLFGDILGLAGGWLMRTNTNGTIIDGKIFGGFTTERAVDAFRRVSGDVTMVLESSSSSLNGQMNNGLLDVWVVHVNPSFSIQWTALLGGVGADVPIAMTQDINGNSYIAAFSDSNLPNLPMNKGGFDVWVIKLDPGGEMLWQKTFGGTEDDRPSDILIHPDGSVYVTVESRSSNGDFNVNEGINDIWLLQLDDATGATISKKRYGGTGNDFNAHLDKYGDDHLVFTATTTSDDGDLTGNKGLTDVWVFNTDLAGNLTQQMNYGGTLNDFAVDLLTLDSVFHVVSTSLSSNENVPPNSLAQTDMWYFSLNTNPLLCSDQFVCIMDSAYTNELFPPDNNSLLCVNGCTAGYGPGPNFIPGDCPDFNNASSYFKIHTDTTAELLTVSVSSSEFNRPRIAIFKTMNCNSFQQVVCATGEFGSVLISYLEIQPLTTYIVAISDDEGNIGEYELCASTLNVDFCNEGDRIFVTNTSLGSPLNGPYKPGEEVTICYELYDWNKLDCNGFQGLIPSFGPGWDSIGFDIFGQPLQIDSMILPVVEGFWDWYMVGDVHYNISNPINGYDGGQGMPAGWFFTNTGDPPPANEPDQTTGDINSCLPTPDKWKVCFTLPVVSECEENLDCSVTMKTFGDGELGINPNLACVYDQPEVFTANLQCCINPSIDNIQDFSICSGDTLLFAPETNLLPPVTYTWTADPDPFIEGAYSDVQAPYFYQILTTEAAIPLSVRYSMRAEGGGCFTEPEDFVVTVLPLPTSKIDITGPTIVCSGSTINLTFENTGDPPFIIDLFRDGEHFADILIESPFEVIAIDPVFSSRLTIGSVRDANCEGDGLSFVDVTIKPVKSAFIDSTICAGDSIIVGDTLIKDPGIYVITLEGEAENNCDSVININLGVIPPLFENITEVICTGDTLFVLGIPYTESTNELIEYFGPEGCPNYIQLDLLVKDTFSSAIMQTICFGDTVTFFGVQIYQEGIYAHTDEVTPGCFQQTVLNLDVLPEIFINDLDITADNGNNNGAIVVEVIGGNPPFSFKWNTGQTTESLFNIMHGMYSLTVTDRLGCNQVFDFEVPFFNSTTTPTFRESLNCRPTLAKSGESISLYNLSGELIEIKSLAWLDLSGKQLQHVQHVQIEGNAYYAASMPAAVTSGIYFLRVILADDREIQFRIAVY